MKLREQLDVIQKDVHDFKSQALVELAEIRRDLQYHIRRTDILEAKLEDQHKVYTFIVLTGRLLVIAAAGAAVVRLLWDIVS
jgi:hypothetical protein